MSKHKNVRSGTKYAALKPHLNLRGRKQEIEDIASYIHLLNDEERDWMNRFTEEYVNCNLKHDGPRIHDEWYEPALNLKNNARNRDVLVKNENSPGGVDYFLDHTEAIENSSYFGPSAAFVEELVAETLDALSRGALDEVGDVEEGF